jgi:hypothetical protein
MQLLINDLKVQVPVLNEYSNRASIVLLPDPRGNDDATSALLLPGQRRFHPSEHWL